MQSINARTTTIGFDDFQLSGGRPAQGLPKHYDGLLWKGFNVYNSQYGPFGGSGYEYGCTSGTQAAVSNGHRSASVFLKDGTFTLDSLNMTAGWDTKLTVDITGYRAGEAVYHQTVTLTDKAPLDVQLHFENVDRVTFDPSHGKPDDLIGSGDNMIFDDLVFSDVTHVESAPAMHPVELHPVVQSVLPMA